MVATTFGSVASIEPMLLETEKQQEPFTCGQLPAQQFYFMQ